MSSAIQLGFDALERATEGHAPELARLIPIAQRLAAERGVITVEDVRRAAGLLESDGRRLSYLGALMKAAGLKRTGTYRRSELPVSHGNLAAEWSCGPIGR